MTAITDGNLQKKNERKNIRTKENDLIKQNPYEKNNKKIQYRRH